MPSYYLRLSALKDFWSEAETGQQPQAATYPATHTAQVPHTPAKGSTHKCPQGAAAPSAGAS